MCLDGFVRHTDPVYAPDGQTSFTDGYPFLLAAHSSLLAINKNLKEPITMPRFRPNIVVENSIPYDEDKWRDIIFKSNNKVINPVVMTAVKPCDRCKVPTIDLELGILHPENEPIRSMKKFRSGEALGFGNEQWSQAVRSFLIGWLIYSILSYFTSLLYYVLI